MTPLLRYEYLLNWAGIIFYISATIAFVYAVFFENPRKLSSGMVLTMSGLALHSVAIALRWYESGHGPYLNRFEGISSSVWMLLVIYLIVAFKLDKLKPLGLVVLPAGLLLLAAGLLNTPEIEYLPPTFHTIWLIIHIFFNKLALGSILLAIACAVFYLKKEAGWASTIAHRLPDIATLDIYTYRLCGFAFVFWTITIIAGAIWAHKSWGRYWGWDPIETWSVITWLVFGLYMHMRRFRGLKGRKAALFIIICFLFVIATLFIIPFITKTIHTEYLISS